MLEVGGENVALDSFAEYSGTASFPLPLPPVARPMPSRPLPFTMTVISPPPRRSASPTANSDNLFFVFRGDFSRRRRMREQAEEGWSDRDAVSEMSVRNASRIAAE